MTEASTASQVVSHTLPHTPPEQYSTLPSASVWPPVSRTAPCTLQLSVETVHKTMMLNRHLSAVCLPGQSTPDASLLWAQLWNCFHRKLQCTGSCTTDGGH